MNYEQFVTEDNIAPVPQHYEVDKELPCCYNCRHCKKLGGGIQRCGCPTSQQGYVEQIGICNYYYYGGN